MIVFRHEGIDAALARRRLLCTDLRDFLQRSLERAHCRCRGAWQVDLGATLLFDRGGLRALADAIEGYRGPAATLAFALKPSPEARRDYFSHNACLAEDRVMLPVTARRTDGTTAGATETLEIALPELSTPISFPLALTPPDWNRTPLGLLMPYSCEHDLLFANQIAIIANIADQVRRSPSSWLRALFARHRGSLRQRLPLYWNRIDPSAQIHPTAVVEGSQIGPHCRIGAHCVVRYSVLGSGVLLHDGAKVEYSAVDDRSWLMHDLVCYRNLVECDVFLIHGPYQFSYFQHQSAAFATIMMDYRPDAREIGIESPGQVAKYQGRFLGALLREGARVFGGTLTAPGITVPPGREVYANLEVVRAKDLKPSAEQAETVPRA